MSTPRTARDRARAEIMAELLAAARSRLATDGAAALSLRAVARDLGMASSAVYRYVESRDALLTLLILEGYGAVGEVAEQAAAGARDAGLDPAQTWLAVARAIRGWALANEHSYALVYGTPVPGYQAPQDTVPAATRLWAVIVEILRAARAAGTLVTPGPEFPTDGVLSEETYAFAGLPSSGPGAREAGLLVGRSFTLFSSLLGAITAELFGHLHGAVLDTSAIFDATVVTAAAGVGLRAEVPGDDRDA